MARHGTSPNGRMLTQAGELLERAGAACSIVGMVVRGALHTVQSDESFDET